MSTILIIILVVLIVILLAKLSKLLFKTDIYLGFLIMIRTKRYIKYLDRLARPKKFLNTLADIGIVIAFGAFGFDYVIKDRIKSKFKRVLLFILSSVVLGFLTVLLVNSLFANNPLLTPLFKIILEVLTAIMGLSGFTLALLIFSAYDIIAKLFAGNAGQACPGVGLVVPGVKMPKVDFVIPWYGWIILIISAIIHEFSHGTLLRVVKAKVKSMGFILAGILPLGAFVEPDEKKLHKKSKKSIIRMYSAGPMSNVLLTVIFVIILLIISPFISNYSHSIALQKNDYLVVYSTQKTTNICGSVYDNPAYGVLKKNDKLISVNDIPVKTQSGLISSLKLKENNKFVVYNLDTNKERTVYVKPNEVGRLGITTITKDDPNFKVPWKYFFLKNLYSVVLWTALLNFFIASVNYLPTVPFDGGGMSQIIFYDYLPKRIPEEKRMKKVSRFFGILIVFILLLNIIPYFF